MTDVLESDAPAEVGVQPETVAPWLHTVFLLTVLALWGIYGALHWRLLLTAMPRVVVYANHIVLQSLLLGATIAGLYHRREFIAAALGKFTASSVAGDVGRGILIYLGASVAIIVISIVIRPLHLTHQKAAVEALLPHNFGELALWMLVSLAAGCCEEFVFRGYLMRQLASWFGNVWVAVGVSALLFGCMHFYEGSAAVFEIGGLGLVYGVVAVRQGNLRTVMVAHFLQDALAGLFLYLRR